MSGKDKVVSGTRNKLTAALANVKTSQQNAESARKQMEAPQPKDNANATLVIGVGVAAVVATGIVLAAIYRNASPIQKAQYRFKFNRALGSLQDIAGSVAQQFLSTKDKVVKKTRQVAGTLEDEEEELEEAYA